MSAEAERLLKARIEAGRLFFARPWRFLTAATQIDGLPAPAGIEVAFAGRSNVGKSTGEVMIVDMPGYGYARASKADSAAWNALVFAYLRGRANLRRVYLLIDSRHGLKANDIDVLDLLDKAAVSYQIVLTKADKLKPAELEKVTAAVAAAIAKRPAAYPEIIATSAEKGSGIDLLRAEIAALAAAPADPPALN